jgi:pyridoxamine 5'-phosphate oxidase family protein
MGGSAFTPAEIAYLHDGRRLGRIATVGRDGMPHVVPSGWTHNRELDTIDVTGRAVEDTKKFRDVVRTGRAAIVIDDIASVNPFRPRAIEVRGPAEAVREPVALIRIHPPADRLLGNRRPPVGQDSEHKPGCRPLGYRCTQQREKGIPAMTQTVENPRPCSSSARPATPSASYGLES